MEGLIVSKLVKLLITMATLSFVSFRQTIINSPRNFTVIGNRDIKLKVFNRTLLLCFVRLQNVKNVL